MTLLREVINIPESIGREDFVLRLNAGIEHGDQTVRRYVVTDQLAACFDQAMGVLGHSLESDESRGVYLHGSFGSGKSHFMAVLHLILNGHEGARSIPALQSTISRHSDRLQGRKFLLVPYHMIGARGMEPAILGGYADHAKKLHPDAPPPSVYRSEGLLEDAVSLRTSMDDESFFRTLNGGNGDQADADGWGALGASWDAASFEAAVAAPPHAENRERLVSTLVSTVFRSYGQVTSGSVDAYVDLDRGLAAVTRHAKELGYDAVVLFLDELILWLASHAADYEFLQREGQKISKLVESQNTRVLPIVSFVARQRDLREFLGEGVTGAERESVGDVLQYWEGRFGRITLEDRNLPAVAQQRLLAPRDPASREMLDQAFQEATQRPDVMNVLLTGQATKELFRQVYPFSPALVDTLVALSSMLQRERTALKVMLQILVEQRERLKLGDLVPVGDLYDVMARQSEPFTETLRIQFEHARRLWEERTRPILARKHGLTLAEAESTDDVTPNAVAFRRDARLAKTLILSALAPGVEALRGLTASRLAALNHGTIRTPVPGAESTVVLGLFRDLAAEIGEIRLQEGMPDPQISLELVGVDTSLILQKAATTDNAGNRRRMIRKILVERFQVEGSDQLFSSRKRFRWRATERWADIRFDNVRELTTNAPFLAEGDDWKVIVDFPFDDGHTPADDKAQIDRFNREHGEATKTLVWMPAFLSEACQKDLGILVILDHVLTGERVEQYADHLSADDRIRARTLLESRRGQLSQKVVAAMQGAYGIADPPPGTIDEAHANPVEERIVSLDPTFSPRPPVGADLGAALERLVGQALEHQYPAHPRFDEDTSLTDSSIRKVWDQIEMAIEQPGQRLEVDRPVRPLLRKVVKPLHLGDMGEQYLWVNDERWRTHFDRKLAQEKPETLTVADLRRWMDEPDPMGLPKNLGNLIILTYAALTQRTFYQHGGPYRRTGVELPDDLELRAQPLPDVEAWEKARDRAASIFGVTSRSYRSAANVQSLAVAVQEVVSQHDEACRDLPVVLLGHLERWCGDDARAAPRYRTAVAVADICEGARDKDATATVQAIADAKLETSDRDMGTSLKKADEVVRALHDVEWAALDAMQTHAGDRAEEAARIASETREALRDNELATGLGARLRELQREAVRILTPRKPKPKPGTKIVDQGNLTVRSLDEARDCLDNLGTKISEGAELDLDLSWTIRKSSKSEE